MFWAWPTKPHGRVVNVCSWVSSLKSKSLCLCFTEAAPLCMNKYLLGQQRFYSPSVGHSAGMEETCVQVPVPMPI